MSQKWEQQVPELWCKLLLHEQVTLDLLSLEQGLRRYVDKLHVSPGEDRAVHGCRARQGQEDE